MNSNRRRFLAIAAGAPLAALGLGATAQAAACYDPNALPLSQKSRRRALAYVLLNARKHLARRAPRVGRVDPASSGPWFSGWREGVEAFARSPAPVARAATWLLRVGWRRHGPLDPSEVPGLRTA